ncbi:MAG TPA: gluconate 2-dehydrogenase subunit 3 family protein [Acidimicrobiales bacterium]|jgi:hypothetical protein|nr:gluconate 2-dehydrogenase subunit 3 family protein [Acidimicrobiales bacterium]
MDIRRRSLLQAFAGAGLGRLLPAPVLAAVLAACDSSPSHSGLDAHEQKVIEEATARLVPGPRDDPLEAGHPGAREAGVTNYISTMLAAASWNPPHVFAGGPFSDRAGHATDDMAQFLPLNPGMQANWQRRLVALRKVYAEGIASYDHMAQVKGAGQFVHLAPDQMDVVLATNPAVPGLPAGYAGFTDLLFEHTIEGMYCVPEYGGNAGLVGWHDIGFAGDVQPRGYTAAEVSSPLDTNHYTPSDTVAKVLALLSATAPAAP